MNADLAKYPPLWEMSVPPEFKDDRKWDFSEFDRGECFVHKRLPQAEFDDTVAQARRRGLDRHPKKRNFEKLVVNAVT